MVGSGIDDYDLTSSLELRSSNRILVFVPLVGMNIFG